MKKYLSVLILFTFSIFYSSNINSQTDIINKIKEQIPKDTFLREIELIPDNDIDSYAGIYIENPVIAEIPLEIDDFGYYSSCPESTAGQTIAGIYHLFLFSYNKIISDIIIPPSYEQAYDNNTQRLEICYFNSKYNNCYYFYGLRNCDNQSKTKLEKTKLISFKDCTGRGLRHEFVLVGETYACGWTNYLIAGYNKENNEMILYEVQDEKYSSYWNPRFHPNDNGVVIVETQCGDHGNDTFTKRIYKFDKKDLIYELINIERKQCE